MSRRPAAGGRGSALEDTRRQKTVVALLCLLAVALVVAAWLAGSYVPLFFVWLPQLAIPVYLSRSSRRGAPEDASVGPGPGPASPGPATAA